MYVGGFLIQIVLWSMEFTIQNEYRVRHDESLIPSLKFKCLNYNKPVIFQSLIERDAEMLTSVHR